MKKLRNLLALFSTQLNYDRGQFAIRANHMLQK